ncbi:hypothetical protein A2966_05200 [Candidatus Roizmanbacteria bacterium RIFCSPLOWO2_01_FULL_41_22]|uniref:R3H domain-containing protein n=2 Tax=Candidatus Roizmaniibacteriota TaxID=1752723 RepID=A0A1F7I756_9BACT|nr:MAG: hypothetical protein A3F34_00445 [Candidatus Roizmanbacteria bacterium RIFCSPHIGHO2_12_FULL_44_10]OGK52518.1 MAG: hypothetical protein A2966_05200 [Candidatus Roizmanbacteria bacterium RIFCSPLOWO2_01_FULL_41_22]
MEEEQKIINEVASELFEKLGLTAEITMSNKEGVHIVHFKTEEDAPLLIGRHAHTLAALQRVLSAMLYKKFERKVDVLVDVNDYRAVQKERLSNIADSVAQRVVEEKRNARLSSFSPYERKIIHEHISSHYHSLESKSEGEGLDRVLVVSIKE